MIISKKLLNYIVDAINMNEKFSASVAHNGDLSGTASVDFNFTLNIQAPFPEKYVMMGIFDTQDRLYHFREDDCYIAGMLGIGLDCFLSSEDEENIKNVFRHLYDVFKRNNMRVSYFYNPSYFSFYDLKEAPPLPGVRYKYLLSEPDF